MVPILFLVLSTLFIVTLLRSLFKLIFGEEEYKTGSSLIRLFIIPLLSLVAFLVFVLVFLPNME